MLPFLKPKGQVGLIIKTRTPDSVEESHSEGNEDAGLEACAEDLIRAVHAKDAKGVCAALKAAYELCESDGGGEGDAESHSFDAQNMKAAGNE